MKNTKILLSSHLSIRKALLVFLLLVSMLGMFLIDLNFFSDFTLPQSKIVITLDLLSSMFSILFVLCCFGLNLYKPHDHSYVELTNDYPFDHCVQSYNKNLDCNTQSSTFSGGPPSNVYRNVNKNRVGQLYSSFSLGKIRHFSSCYHRNAELYSDSSPFNFPVEYKYNDNSKRDKIVITIDVWVVRDIDLFVANFIKSVSYNHFSVFIKIRHDGDLYKMAGAQFGFIFTNVEQLYDLHKSIIKRMDRVLEGYNISDEFVNYIQIVLYTVNPVFIAEYKLDKSDIINKRISNNQVRLVDSIKEVPVTINFKDVLNPIVCEIRDGYITNIPVNIKGDIVNFLDLIKKQNKVLVLRKSNKKEIIHEFDKDWVFYLVDSVRPYVLAHKHINTRTIKKIRYSLFQGVMIDCITDHIGENDVVVRHYNNYIINIVNNKVINIKYNMNLIPIKRIINNNLSFTENPNIGVIDFETIECRDGVNRVYCLGFKTNLDKKPVTYFIEEHNNYDDYDRIMLKFIDELLRSKYKDVTFYCHNLSGFDVHFMLGVLLRYNALCVSDEQNTKYTTNFVFRDKNIIKIIVSKNINGTNRKFTIQDSLAILVGSQRDLCRAFEVETQKTDFPYLFLHERNLGYLGNTPEISFYEGLTKNDYKLINKSNWSFKDESIKYLENDLDGLHQILVKANKSLFLNYGLDITNSLTISSLAMSLYHTNYYTKANIPLIKNAQIYRDIKLAYYGGITEVYKPYGTNLNYYDVNSLYPYASLNDMPGSVCYREEYINDVVNIQDLFGFYYCEITCKDNYLGLLPVRESTGLIFPVGKWTGWYFSEELKFAYENGYGIKVLNGYSFNRESDVFSSYVNDVYTHKANAKTKTEKAIAKSLLNNLLGRFGISLSKPTAVIVNEKTFNEMSCRYKINSYTELSDDKYLVSYIPKLDHDVIKSHNLSITKLVSKYGDKESTSHSSTSVAISAAVNSYARIHISKIKLLILNSGGKIYYSDTDSIVTDLKLPDTMVHKNELGKLKLEHEISKSIFISGKSYALITNNDQFVNKYKGLKSSSLTWQDYTDLLNNIPTTGIKRYGKKYHKEGYVKIIDKIMNLDYDVYKRRIKIFKNGMWVDTKPININRIDTSLIIYNTPPLFCKKIGNLIVLLVELLVKLKFGVNPKSITILYKLPHSITKWLVLCILPISYSFYLLTHYADNEEDNRTESTSSITMSDTLINDEVDLEKKDSLWDKLGLAEIKHWRIPDIKIDLFKYKEIEETRLVYTEKTRELNQTWDIITKRLIERTIENKESVKFDNRKELMDYMEFLLKDKDDWVKTKLLDKLSDNSEFLNHLVKQKNDRIDSFMIDPTVYYKKK